MITHSPLPLQVQDLRVYTREVETRFPFRFGKAVLTRMPILHLRVRVASGGREVTGVSASGVPPLWFDKDASKSHARQVRDLLLSVRFAYEAYRALPPGPAYALHAAGEPLARARGEALGQNELVRGFGVALLDAALVDAACRLAQTPFHALLRTDALGLPETWGHPWPEAPSAAMDLRHTVGMADALSAEEAPDLDDGLPRTLPEVVRAVRPKYFKIKVSGDLQASVDRLRRIASVLDAEAGDYRATLDGNEQFPDMATFGAFIRALAADAPLRNLWNRTLWIEQPVERKAALDPAMAEDIRSVSRLKPLLIDEADGDDTVVDRCLDLGYGGISAKNGKGIFRTLHSFAAIARRNASAAPGAAPAFLSGEDLTHAPVVPLHQDLCVAAALGLTHIERNGHHYIEGFRFLSPAEREATFCEYPELYAARPGSLPHLRIEGGRLDLSGINAHALGTRSEPDWEALVETELPAATHEARP